eukprot:scaffold2420_cov259-Pinguiococcus_pyrenoidosus.AAC.3
MLGPRIWIWIWSWSWSRSWSRASERRGARTPSFLPSFDVNVTLPLRVGGLSQEQVAIVASPMLTCVPLLLCSL